MSQSNEEGECRNLGTLTDQPRATDAGMDHPCAAEACCDAEPEPLPKLSDLLYSFRRASEKARRLSDEHADAICEMKAARLAIQMNAARCGCEPGLAVVASDTVYLFADDNSFRTLPMKFAHEMDE